VPVSRIWQIDKVCHPDLQPIIAGDFATGRQYRWRLRCSSHSDIRSV